MAAARPSKGLNMNRPESGNRARVARYRAKHHRIEFFPSADVLKIIELHKAQGAPMPDLFGLEQAPPRIFDRVRAAGGVAFVARDLRDSLHELKETTS